MTSEQISPNPNPEGNRIFLNEDKFATYINDRKYVNNGEIFILKGEFHNINTGGSYFINNNFILNGNSIENKEFATFNNKRGASIERTEKAQIMNYGNLINDGTIECPLVSRGGTYSGSGTLEGDFWNDANYNPGNSVGGHKIDGDFVHLSNATMEVELGGDDNFGFDRIDTEHDFTEVTEDMVISGGSLEVSLIDDFKLQRGQEFIIAKIGGKVLGQFEGLGEGDSVGVFESIYGNEIGLNITYIAGDGNDIGLYTAPLTNPETIFDYDEFLFN